MKSVTMKFLNAIFILSWIINISTAKINYPLIINTFLDQIGTVKNLVLCDPKQDDEVTSNVVQIAEDQKLWVTHWSCSEAEIPKLSEALYILNRIEPKHMRSILKQKHIQHQLASNTWMIIPTNRSENTISKYFDQDYLRLGLNINMFFIARDKVVQILGKGSYEVDFKVEEWYIWYAYCWGCELTNLFWKHVFQIRGTFQNVNISQSMEMAKKRKNFQGMPFYVNYAAFAPYCIIDKSGMVTGLIPEIIGVAAKRLNLTLIPKPSKPENDNIWHKRKVDFVPSNVPFPSAIIRIIISTNRLDNGSYVGMISEVMDGIADSGIAGFSATTERFQLVDFSPTLIHSFKVLIMKTQGEGDDLSFVTRNIDQFSP